MYKVMGVKKAILAVVLFASVLGLILFSLSKIQPYWAVSGTARKIPIYNVETQRKAVSLGINCAWDDSDIYEMLSILKNEDVKATFFVVGDWCEKYPEALRAIYEAGHEIGSHSDSHPDMTKLSKEDIIEELRGCAEKIEGVTGEKTVLFRAPSGAYNNLLIETASEMGYYTIQWDVDSLDWKGLSGAEIYGRIMSKITNGSITLFHSGAKNTAGILGKIIKDLKNEGFEIVKVSELIYKDNYYIDHAGTQKKESES